MENKFKIGNKVKCVPGFNNDSNWNSYSSGGAAWIEGKIYTINSISKNDGHNEVLWFEEIKGKGCFSQSVTLYVGEPNYEIY